MIGPSIGMGPDAVAQGVEYIKADPEGMFGPWFVNLFASCFLGASLIHPISLIFRLMALIGLTFMMVCSSLAQL